jgi:hypothetical protein
MRAYPVWPGVPAAGHVDRGGWWHPGPVDGCPKGSCGRDRPAPGRPRWCREHRRPYEVCERYKSTHLRPREET